MPFGGSEFVDLANSAAADALCGGGGEPCETKNTLCSEILDPATLQLVRATQETQRNLRTRLEASSFLPPPP